MEVQIPWTKESFGESLSSEQDPAVDSPPESLMVTGAAVAAGVLTNRVLKATWKQARGTEPPINPAAASVSWSDALIWAASVGAAIGVSRVCARRTAASLLR